MGEIMNSPKGVKPGVPERASTPTPHAAPATIHAKQPESKPFDTCDTDVSNL